MATAFQGHPVNCWLLYTYTNWLRNVFERILCYEIVLALTKKQSQWTDYPVFSSKYHLRSSRSASLSCSFVPQGLFLADRMHLYLDLLCHMDYFGQPDASLPCSFSPQGLFQPIGCIPSFLFCSTGIISTGQMHPCLPLLHHRDYFSRSDTSPIAESISARPFRQIPDLFTSTYR